MVAALRLEKNTCRFSIFINKCVYAEIDLTIHQVADELLKYALRRSSSSPRVSESGLPSTHADVITPSLVKSVRFVDDPLGRKYATLKRVVCYFEEGCMLL